MGLHYVAYISTSTPAYIIPTLGAQAYLLKKGVCMSVKYISHAQPGV